MEIRRTLAVALCVASVGMVHCAPTAEWQLPVSLGQSRDDVRQILGPPKETIPGSLQAISAEAAADFIRRSPGQTSEYYYSSGLMGRYDGDRLFSITVVARSDYQGWIVRTAPIVADVRVADDKPSVDTSKPATDRHVKTGHHGHGGRDQ